MLNSPHKLCCNCRAHNKNIITHSILSPAFVMVRSGRKILGLSPKGKVTDFDSVMCGFESHQPSLLGCACTWQWFILHRPSDENPSSSTELIKGASNVPDGNPRKNEVLYLTMTFVAAGGKEPQQQKQINSKSAIRETASTQEIQFSGQNARLITGKP